MISEGSCDSEEDWSNDAENTDLITAINYILKYIKKETSYGKLILYFTIFQFLTVFFANKCSLGEHERLLFKYIKKKKILPTPNICMY